MWYIKYNKIYKIYINIKIKYILKFWKQILCLCPTLYSLKLVTTVVVQTKGFMPRLSQLQYDEESVMDRRHFSGIKINRTCCMIRMRCTMKKIKFRMTGFGTLMDMVLFTKMGNRRKEIVLGKILIKNLFIQCL